jgi:hypothetical protein
MLKFIPQFSCWKIGPQHVLVIASCAKTHEVRVYSVSDAGFVQPLDTRALFPDLRLFVPCRWHALSAIQKANIRLAFGAFLCEMYGEETWIDPRCQEVADDCG